MQKIFKIALCCIILVSFSNGLKAQEIVKTFDQNSFTIDEITNLKTKFGNHKTLIEDYEKQLLIALSYFPELKDIKVKFRLKNRKTPLTTKPTLFSMLCSSKKRTYVITISKKSTDYLENITFKNLRFNAQIGVLGHELSHVSDYINKGFGKMSHIAFIEIFSKKEVDKFEFNTDWNCINHGMGYQLLDWSTNVRQNLKIDNWRGTVNLTADEKSERYMNPSTIKDIISTHPLYQENKE